jgi:hypothetical protein
MKIYRSTSNLEEILTEFNSRKIIAIDSTKTPFKKLFKEFKAELTSIKVNLVYSYVNVPNRANLHYFYDAEIFDRKEANVSIIVTSVYYKVGNLF